MQGGTGSHYLKPTMVPPLVTTSHGSHWFKGSKLSSVFLDSHRVRWITQSALNALSRRSKQKNWINTLLATDRSGPTQLWKLRTLLATLSTLLHFCTYSIIPLHWEHILLVAVAPGLDWTPSLPPLSFFCCTSTLALYYVHCSLYVSVKIACEPLISPYHQVPMVPRDLEFGSPGGFSLLLEDYPLSQGSRIRIKDKDQG